ncbi:beta-phosphoglucomutase [Pontibacillus salicampi]|uniref:Beta-phosphoglucomutase n=1 Tax=Pontibacillus salicampi TaxID=1449801 RepID=A0ABV6LPQ9_9BACI
MAIDAIIFDLDGVIVDTVPFHYQATKRVADELQVSFTEKDNLHFQGRPREDLVQELTKRGNRFYSSDEKANIGNRKNQYYQELLKGLSEKHIMPGIIPFLTEVKKASIPIALASSSSNARLVLKKLGLTEFFDIIMNPHELTKGKPDPEIFTRACDELQAEYHRSAAIEDGEAGLAAILQTPMFSIGVGEETFLERADWHIYSSRELSLETLQDYMSMR